jgi:upstream activation factor subunit UAF30
MATQESALAKTVPAKKVPAKRAANPAFMKALTPSAELAAVIGATPLARTEVVKQVWVYIKEHNLQDAKNKRNVNAMPRSSRFSARAR